MIVRDRPLHHSAHSSWVEPCLSSPAEAEGLSFSLDAGNFWWQLYADARAYAAERIGRDGFLATSHSMGPLDLAYDLRGDGLYTDLYDDPQGVQRLLGVCTDAVIRMADAQRAIQPPGTGIPPRTDGSFWVPGWGYNVMIPGGGCHFTADIGCQLSPAMFTAVELPWLQRLVDHEPGCILHSHSAATHQQPIYAALRGLEMIQIVADPNVPDPVEDIDAVLDRVGMKPVLLTARADRIRANIDRLARGRIVLRTDVTTEDEARELLALVRGHSRVR